MKPRIRILIAATALFGVAGLVAALVLPKGVPDYTPPEVEVAPFADFVARKQRTSRDRGVPEPFVEHWSRRTADGRAPEAILYVHGFGASKGEGMDSVERIAAQRGADVYYLRLPGHGESPEAHGAVPFEAYLDESVEALVQMEALSDRIVVVGTSTGGNLATWLAAEYPDRIDALVTISPFYGFANPATAALSIHGGYELVELALGEDRYPDWSATPTEPGYDQHWMMHQKLSSLLALDDLRRFVVRDEVFGRVTTPTLQMRYERDAEHKDSVVDLSQLHRAWRAFNGGQGLPAPSRQVAIAEGDHVLTSAYIRSDKSAVEDAIVGFLAEAMGPPPPPAEPRAEPDTGSPSDTAG